MASIDFDPEDYLDEVSDRDLMREVKRRQEEQAKHGTVSPEFRTSGLDTGTEVAREVLSIMRRGDIAGATALLERVAFPKWSSTASCIKAYRAVKPNVALPGLDLQ
jgi:hypothetical protein